MNVFKPCTQNIRTLILLNLLQRYWPSSTFRGWIKFKIAAGSHPEKKLINCFILAIVWPVSTKFRMIINKSKLWKSEMADGCQLESQISQYLCSVWLILTKFGSSDFFTTIIAFCGSHCYCCPFRQSTPKNYFIVWIGIFKSNRQLFKLLYYIKYYCSDSSQILYNNKDTKYSSWVVHIRSPQIQDGC